MALQVWLPLNGDIKNYGVSDLVFSNNGITSNASGKIGSCYYSPDYYNYSLISNKTLTLGNKQSMFCWVKFINLTSSSSLGGSMVGQHRYPSNTGMGLTIKYVSSTTGYLSINTGTGSDRTFNAYCGSTLLQADTWYHVGYTYDGSTVKLYVNGVLDGTHNVGTLSNPADYVHVFAWSFSGSSGTGIYGGYHLYGYLNDVRIYDNVVSYDEVKEISKALILYYPLRDAGIEPTTNLYTSWSGTCYNASNSQYGYGTGTDIYYTALDNDVIKVYMGTSEQTCYPFVYFDTLCPTVGNKRTLSFDFYPTILPGNGVNFYSWNTGGTVTWKCNGILGTGENISTIEENKWAHIEVTIENTGSADSGWGYMRIGLGSHTSNTANYWLFKNVQIEEKDHATTYVGKGGSRTGLIAYDCSGYNRNGTVTASTCPIPVSGSARNSICYQFDGSDDYIVSSVKQGDILADNKFTISAWVYPTILQNCKGVFGPHESTDGQLLGICFCQCESTGLGFALATGSSWGNAIIDTNYTLNTWIHYVMTYDGFKMIVYKNGVKLNETTGAFAPATTNNIWVGRTYPDSIRYWKGKISDVRVYATTLSADDILQEYHNFASIYNNGSLSAYDFSEV